MCNYVISAAGVTADRRGGENNELEQQREPGTCQFFLRLFKKVYYIFFIVVSVVVQLCHPVYCLKIL